MLFFLKPIFWFFRLKRAENVNDLINLFNEISKIRDKDVAEFNKKTNEVLKEENHYFFFVDELIKILNSYFLKHYKVLEYRNRFEIVLQDDNLVIYKKIPNWNNKFAKYYFKLEKNLHYLSIMDKIFIYLYEEIQTKKFFKKLANGNKEVLVKIKELENSLKKVDFKEIEKDFAFLIRKISDLIDKVDSVNSYEGYKAIKSELFDFLNIFHDTKDNFSYIKLDEKNFKEL